MRLESRSNGAGEEPEDHKRSFKDNWMKELDSEVTGSSKDTQQIQPKPKTQISRTVRPAGGQESTKEIEKGTLFDHEEVKHSTRTVRPAGGLESTQSCVSMPRCSTLVSLYAKRFGAGQWSFLGHGSEKKWYSVSEDSPQGEWDKIAELMMLTFGESTHPVFRSTSPLSRQVLKSKGGGKLSIHYCADSATIETVFSHNYFCKSAQSLRSSRRNVLRI